jgi:hypothetical protein
MTTRSIIKQVRVYDANGQACIAYREVTPLEEYGKAFIHLVEYACLAVVVVVIIATVLATNGLI